MRGDNLTPILNLHIMETIDHLILSKSHIFFSQPFFERLSVLYKEIKGVGIAMNIETFSFF